MAKCVFCNQERKVLKTAVIAGKFGSYCELCLDDDTRLASGSSAAYNRARDKEDYRKDILQPTINGKINKEFVDAYPEESRKMFTEEQLNEI